MLEMWFCPPGCNCFYLKHWMLSKRTRIHGMITGQDMSEVFVNCSQNEPARDGRVLMEIYFILKQWTSSRFFQAVQFMTRASKNILKTNSYTEPKILTLLKALKTINWLLYPKTWMCISQGGRKKRHTQQYSAFTARRRMPIWVVKSLKKSSAFCDALSNT